MNECMTHKTIEGDRWDALALRYYGDPLHLGPLLRANPGLAAEPTLPAGAQAAVPIIDLADVAPDAPSGVAWR
jgi:phage tail protein X